MKNKIIIGIATAGALLATGAVAQTVATGTFNVRMKVLDECSVKSTETLDFGDHGVWSSNVDSQASLVVACTNGTPFSIGLDKGLNGSSVTDRQMAGDRGGNIAYGLFRDASRAQPWGDDGANTVAGTGTGVDQTLTIYGRVPPPSGAVIAGNYSDTITVAVTY
ncbi:MAG TPA: spore coat U domain-containing protein [Kaistiaceae bacterium]|nr:spore coat U domain-containing protein [Kaistiaceae bacterium]